MVPLEDLESLAHRDKSAHLDLKVLRVFLASRDKLEKLEGLA